jgi:hypothetical protein
MCLVGFSGSLVVTESQAQRGWSLLVVLWEAALSSSIISGSLVRQGDINRRTGSLWPQGC